MKNYLEHEDKVKYIDGLLARSQDWQWFIDLLQETFDIHDVASWAEYESNIKPTRDVLSYFVKVQEVSEVSWKLSKTEFAELWAIARFYSGALGFEECRSMMTTNLGKLMLFCIWITKLENAGLQSNAKYIYDTRILNQKNYFQLIKLDPFLTVEDALFEYAASITISDFSEPLSCLRDNLSGTVYSFDEQFFTEYQNAVNSYDVLSYQLIEAKPYSTWQEVYLLDMLKVRIKDGILQPLSSFGNETYPDMSTWTVKTLNELKDFFQNQYATFHLDTILFVMHGIEPSHDTKLMHIRLLTEAFHCETNIRHIYSSTSFEIISMLFEKRYFKDFAQSPDYRNLLTTIHGVTDVALIAHLKDKHYPINKTQLQSIVDFCRLKYQKVVDIHNEHDLISFLDDKSTTQYIDMQHLVVLQEKFDNYIGRASVIMVATLFYSYMAFLFSVNESNEYVDKKFLHSEMIRIQQLWQNEYYDKQIQGMQTISHEARIPHEKIDKVSILFLANPIIFAKNCIPCTKKEIIKIMESASEHPLLSLVHRVIVNRVFPNGGETLNLIRHDIDGLLLNQVENLLKDNGYRFLNILDSKDYVKKIHSTYRQHTQMMIAIFQKTEDLYNLIQSETNIELIPYCQPSSLAMVTQLFPVLEIKIQEFASLLGIFPFKKSINDFMQHCDPSSLLREILVKIFQEQESFENVPDLLFVYNIMYNSNSMNIRNDCIHGRDYLQDSSMEFALRATLFALYMIIFRINTIKDNVSDLEDFK